jgi:glycosyltransferase involved in cell wall biosynthesis
MINIYARPSFIGNRFSAKSDKLQTQRLSSRVRAEEMVAFLGEQARLNPEVYNSDDVNIYVKPVSLDVVGEGDYLDFLDGGHFYKELSKRPDVKIIACTQNSYDMLRAEFPNEICLIPHHHVNFENNIRKRDEVKVCGYIGSYSPHTERHYKWLDEQFRQLGLNVTLLTNFEYKTREDAINTYLSMDILVIADWWLPDHNPHKIPTKIINAASFGVPAIATPLAGYKEIEGYYLHANGLDELVANIKCLTLNKGLYDVFRMHARAMATDYHINHIVEKYLELK